MANQQQQEPKQETPVKTYADWTGDFDKYAKPGDRVDEELFDYFLNVLPPECYLPGGGFQVGEPYSTFQGKSTYATFLRVPGGFIYAGHCHYRDTTHRSSDIVFVEREGS